MALFLDRFAAGPAAAFDSVDPDPDGQAVVRRAVQKGLVRQGNVRRVLWQTSRRAVVLLTGTVHAATGGDETNLVRHLSGFYEAVDSGGIWTIARQLPIDTLNHIRGQTLDVALDPARGITVVDTLAVVVGGPYGLAVRLNNAVRLRGVQLDGRAAEYAFGGGVLWIAVPARSHAHVVLDYSLDTQPSERDSVADAVSRSAPTFGAFHNTDVWHPFFGYNSANDLGRAALTVRLPADYHLTTTLPQWESVANHVRTVHGRSAYPTWLLSLIYDRDWQPRTSNVAGVRFETFTTPGFHFSHDALAAALQRIDEILGGRFGRPTPSYIAVVEDRLLGGGGFSVRMNNAVVSGSGAVRLDRLSLEPSSAFAHEVSHGWTMNATGPAANMLREGWATFSESVVLGAEHGPDVERNFWERLRNGYMLGSEGRLSILGSPDNGGVHYSKGAWIFHMLNGLLGDAAFNRAMRAYVQRQADGQPAGYDDLIAAMSRAAGHDVGAFARPWFTEMVVPDLDAQAERDRIIVTQRQATPPFDLPVTLALTTASGATVRRTLHLTHRADTLPFAGGDSITAVRVDPDDALLLRRHWGEVAHFALPVAQAMDAKTVALVGDFSLQAVPAVRTGDLWVVELPLSEGRYVWTWQLDGKPRSPGEGGDPGSEGDARHSGVRTVQPLALLSDAYPR